MQEYEYNMQNKTNKLIIYTPFLLALVRAFERPSSLPPAQQNCAWGVF